MAGLIKTHDQRGTSKCRTIQFCLEMHLMRVPFALMYGMAESSGSMSSAASARAAVSCEGVKNKRLTCDD